MFFKRNKVEVVPESEYTDFGDKYATKKHLALAMCIPGATSFGLLAHRILSNSSSTIDHVANNVLDPATLPPVTSSITQIPVTSDHITAIPIGATTDYVAGASLDVLTTIMNPIIDILVALALPVASLIMIGACFFIILGQKEKAYSMMMNAGMGYVLVQLSPLLLNILKTAGKAVQVQ